MPTCAWDTGSSKLPRAGGQDAPQATAPHPQDPLPNTPPAAPLPCEGTTSLGAPSEWSLLALSACESWHMNRCESSPLTPAPPGSGGASEHPCRLRISGSKPSAPSLSCPEAGVRPQRASNVLGDCTSWFFFHNRKWKCSDQKEKSRQSSSGWVSEP